MRRLGEPHGTSALHATRSGLGIADVARGVRFHGGLVAFCAALPRELGHHLVGAHRPGRRVAPDLLDGERAAQQRGPCNVRRADAAARRDGGGIDDRLPAAWHSEFDDRQEAESDCQQPRRRPSRPGGDQDRDHIRPERMSNSQHRLERRLQRQRGRHRREQDNKPEHGLRLRPPRAKPNGRVAALRAAVVYRTGAAAA